MIFVLLLTDKKKKEKKKMNCDDVFIINIWDVWRTVARTPLEIINVFPSNDKNFFSRLFYVSRE